MTTEQQYTLDFIETEVARYAHLEARSILLRDGLAGMWRENRLKCEAMAQVIRTGGTL